MYIYVHDHTLRAQRARIVMASGYFSNRRGQGFSLTESIVYPFLRRFRR